MEKRFPAKKGAKLLITKRDGQQVEGELITVKPSSLLLLNTEGKDVFVDVGDIKVIRIVKKSKILKGMGINLLVGAGIGAAIGFAQGETTGFFGETLTAWDNALTGAVIFGSLGLFFGGIGVLTSGKNETIQIEGKSEKKIRKTLDYLRKKARVRDYK